MLQKCYHHFFIFAVFDESSVITPLSGVINYVFAFITEQQQTQTLKINH